MRTSELCASCEEDPAACFVNVTTVDGELIDREPLCAECAAHYDGMMIRDSFRPERIAARVDAAEWLPVNQRYHK